MNKTLIAAALVAALTGGAAFAQDHDHGEHGGGAHGGAHAMGGLGGHAGYFAPVPSLPMPIGIPTPSHMKRKLAFRGTVSGRAYALTSPILWSSSGI